MVKKTGLGRGLGALFNDNAIVDDNDENKVEIATNLFNKFILNFKSSLISDSTTLLISPSIILSRA